MGAQKAPGRTDPDTCDDRLSAVCCDLFTGGVLVVSSRADVLHPRQLAVGAAAINRLWQIGAFISPYGFGLARDATGAVRLGLIACAVVASAEVLLILYVRARVASERLAGEHTVAQPIALSS